MRKSLIAAIILLQVVSSLAADSKFTASKYVAPVDNREAQLPEMNKGGSRAQSINQVGPGLLLFPESMYDNLSNSSLGRHVLNHGDGTMQVAVMEQTIVGGGQSRSTYWTFFDGNTWILPMTRVETVRSGWGQIAGMADGRAVTATHVDDITVGSQLAIDALKGFGIWTIFTSGQFPPNFAAADHTWHRIAVDGKDYIHIVFSYFASEPFADLVPRVSQAYAWGRSKDGGLTWDFRFVFQAPGAAPTDPPSQSVGWLTDGDADSYVLAARDNKVGIAGWTWNNPEGANTYRGSDILFAESLDNGDTWTVTNVTNDGLTIPPEEGEDRAGEQMTLVYDNNGEPHIVFATFFSFPDTLDDGTIMIAQNRSYAGAPLYHWSPSTGVSRMFSRFDIPGAAEDVTAPGGCDNYARGTGGGLWWPTIGVDAQNKLYVVFNAPTPGDVDADTLNYLDIYASASKDGGVTWGCPPVNITNSVGTEDKFPSLAELVDDSLHLTYHSDDFNGGHVAGITQTIPTNLVLLTYAAAEVPTENKCTTSVQEINTIPTGYFLSQNYPNPFNPATEISFEIPVTEKVALKIYNMTGQVVATLVDTKLPAGKHHYTWTASGNLASGVYIYQLETESITLCKKLVLNK